MQKPMRKTLLKWLLCGTAALLTLPVDAQSFKDGILVDENIFETAPFPESHASTIAETPAGLVAAWFGGTKERNPDVGIWVSRIENGK